MLKMVDLTLFTQNREEENGNRRSDYNKFSERINQKLYDYGDQLADKWTDTAGNKEYEFPWHISHFDTEELEDGEQIQGTYLEAHYTTPFGLQFSNRAFLRCPNGLAAGTYNVTLGAKWGNNAVKDTTWKFTLTQAVPEGGSVAGFTQMPDVAPSNWKATSYAADGITKIETVAISSGTTEDGTNLGTMNLDTRNGDLNSMQEAAYGWNRWKYSAARQWLNSEQPKGKWWTPQDDWDVAPDQLATKDGFLRGLPENMLRAIKTVKVVTYTNTVQDGGEADVTYDKVFLPSLEQMYYNPQISGEGNAHEYWKRRSGSKTKLPQYQALPRMVTYAVENHTSPQGVRLRSASRVVASYPWYVNSSGNASGDGATTAYRFAPLVVI